MRSRIKGHRKLPDSARNFNRAALKSDENRDLLNQAYNAISARDGCDQQPPALSQPNAPGGATIASVTYRQRISENQILRFRDCSSTIKRQTSSTPKRHPNRPQRSPQTSLPPDIGPILASKTRVSARQKIPISGYPDAGPETKRHTPSTPGRHPNRLYSHPCAQTTPVFDPCSPTILCRG